MDKPKYSPEYAKYLANKKKKKHFIFAWQVGILVAFIALWEILARLGILNTFYLVAP